jgi:DNA-directed RNA polymerase specialized sigma24 family protein
MTNFERDVERMTPKLRAAFRKRGLDDSDCNDLIQETWARAWEALTVRNKTNHADNPDSFYFAIGFHVLYEHWRLRRRYSAAEPDEGMPARPNTFGNPDQTEWKVAAGQCLDRLGDAEAALVLDYYAVGPDALSVTTGIRPGTLRARIKRSLDKIRAQFRHEKHGQGVTRSTTESITKVSGKSD